MTTYAIIGDLTLKKGTEKVIGEGLDQLLDAAIDAEEEIEFIAAYGPKLTKSQQAVVDWFDNVDDLGYTLVTPPKFKDDDTEVFANAENVHEAKDIDGAIYKLAADLVEKDKDVVMLALFGDGGDDDLEVLVRRANSAGIEVRDLLDGLAAIEIEGDEDEDEEPAGNPEPEDEGEDEEEADEPEEAPKKPARRTTKAAPTEPPARGKPGRPRKEAAAAKEEEAPAEEEKPTRQRRQPKAKAEPEETPTADPTAFTAEGIDVDALTTLIAEKVVAKIGEKLAPPF